MRAAIFLALPATLAITGASAQGFHPTGLGGGGGLFSPASSPWNADLMVASCDMGGFYRSSDGGTTWIMLDERTITGSTLCKPVWDPRDSNRLYTGAGSVLDVSTDAGLDWAPTAPALPWAPAREMVRSVAIDPDSTTRLLVGTDQAVYVSRDRGVTWMKTVGPQGACVGLFFDRTRGGRIIVATQTGVWVSADGGTTWTDASQGLPSGARINAMAGASAPGSGASLAVAVVSGAANGVFKRRGTAAAWERAGTAGLNPGDEYTFVGMPDADTTLVCVTNDGTTYATHAATFNVFRSTDGAATWTNVYNCNPRYPGANVALGWNALEFGVGWGGGAIGFDVNPRDPSTMLFTNTGELLVTRDAGVSWHQAYSTHAAGRGVPAAGDRWRTNGLNVTSVWRWYADPFDSNRTYLCYTDIGFARSTDRGATWMLSSTGSPWRNTFYDLAFTPVAGTLFAACANKHDIPEWTAIDRASEGNYPGGVSKSTDYGASWTSASTGLPARAVTSIVSVPGGASSYTLYCTAWGAGVYRSTDAGDSWQQINTGLRTDNLHAYSLRSGPHNTLFVLVAGLREGSNFPVHGGLYRSRDAGAHWISVMDSLHWLVDFAVHPTDENVIALTCFDATAGKVQGGVYMTTNGGGHWSRVKQFYNPFCPTFDPRGADTIYVATDNGLWRTTDAGGTWGEVPGPPFRTLTRVFFDPRHPGGMVVCTFGGGAWSSVAAATSVAREDPLIVVACYPSPVRDRLTIDLRGMAERVRAVRVVDMLGRVVADYSVVARGVAAIECDARRWSPGVYAVEVVPVGGVPRRTRVVRVR